MSAPCAHWIVKPADVLAVPDMQLNHLGRDTLLCHVALELIFEDGSDTIRSYAAEHKCHHDPVKSGRREHIEQGAAILRPSLLHRRVQIIPEVVMGRTIFGHSRPILGEIGPELFGKGNAAVLTSHLVIVPLPLGGDGLRGLGKNRVSSTNL